MDDSCSLDFYNDLEMSCSSKDTIVLVVGVYTVAINVLFSIGYVVVYLHKVAKIISDAKFAKAALTLPNKNTRVYTIRQEYKHPA